ncbi:MAG: TAXI family TRAP transporter solute-binding subunit [Sinobacterium sp.]|nr:TAXI family TRAP transporter solute-binding subunit [Sinobacterium sp.]
MLYGNFKQCVSITSFFLTSLLLLTSSNIQASDRHISIGTGGVTGVYYPTGSAICRLVNRGTKTHNIRCKVESTGGSVYNINTIKSGELDLGIAQSDQQYNAVNGLGVFSKAGPDKNIRSAFSIYSEVFTVLARKDANVKTFADLKGKRVNVGNPGSGQRATMETVLDAMGMSMSDFQLVSELKSSEQSQALCDNKVDAIVFFVGHPNGSIKEATTSCESTLVNVSGPGITKLLAEKSYFVSTNIPAGMYKGNDADNVSIGAKATFVTSSKVSNDIVYTVVKAVFDNFSRFQRLHPALSSITKEDMITAGNTAPLHDGAIKFYKEVGLIKE